MTTVRPAPTTDAFTHNRVWHYARRYRWPYLGGFLLISVASFAALAPPLILQRAIDAIADGATRSTLAAYAGVILAVAVAESVLRFYARLAISGSSRRAEYHLRNDLAFHLMRLDQRFYVRARTGDLMARATNDLHMIRNVLGPTATETARTVVMVAVGVGVLLTIDLRLALISIAYLPLVALFFAYIETNAERRYWSVQDQFGRLTDHAQENISGIRAVKAYAREEGEIAAFAEENREMMRRSVSLARYTSALFPVMIFLTGIGTLLVLWVGGRGVVHGNVTIGEFVSFNAVLAILAHQLSEVGWIIGDWQQGIVASRRLNEVLRTPSRIADPAAPAALPAPRGRIELRGVSVHHGGVAAVVGIDLTIEPGTTVAVVGATGGGKTTVAHLLTRLVDPDAGAVLLDGVDLRDYPLAQLRRLVAVVPQESFLFSESLRENLRYGSDDAGDAAIDRAVAVSRMAQDLAQLGDGLDTVIGERGVTLSGGQKQRSALARAVLKDAPVLILDDALSHVDTETEQEILRALRGVMRERTTILIAHRTAALRTADRIVVLDRGRLVEDGTHESLLARRGPYARHYLAQLRQEERERVEDALTDAGAGTGASS